MQILVINTGSSSVKFKVIQMKSREAVLQGSVERIGGDGLISYSMCNGCVREIQRPLPDYETVFRELVPALDSVGRIDAIGHRVAHGGNTYTEPVLINDEVLLEIERASQFAPLHNRVNLMGIKACFEAFGDDIPQVAAFDTSFHATIPPHAHIYPIPYKYYEEYGIRKFGFHGLSHRYVSERCKQLMGNENLKLITCHLGNGCSLAAIKDGKSFDTTMGLTPNEGVMMGTRSGSIDPAILDYIADKESCTYKEILDVCNRQSGLLGVSGISNDYRDLLDSNDERADLALRMQQYQLVKHIGAYLAAMDGADAIVFTGGIGMHAAKLRENICSSLGYAGVILDMAANSSKDLEKCITTSESRIAVYVIPTDEEMIIAQDTYSLVQC